MQVDHDVERVVPLFGPSAGKVTFNPGEVLDSGTPGALVFTTEHLRWEPQPADGQAQADGGGGIGAPITVPYSRIVRLMGGRNSQSSLRASEPAAVDLHTDAAAAGLPGAVESTSGADVETGAAAPWERQLHSEHKRLAAADTAVHIKPPTFYLCLHVVLGARHADAAALKLYPLSEEELSSLWTFLEEKTSLPITLESDFITLLLQRQHAMLRSQVYEQLADSAEIPWVTTTEVCDFG